MKPADHAKLDYSPADRLAIDWLLTSDEPGIRMQVRRDLLGEAVDDQDSAILDGPWMRALLNGQRPDGGFGGDPYKKWWGAHWRLVSLVELGVPRNEPHVLRAAETILDWIASPAHLRAIRVLRGRPRMHASMEGNALAVCIRVGLAADPRLTRLAEALVVNQWPDGGWNCDPNPAATHSSFHESFVPVWALAEFAGATGDAAARDAARRAADFLLDHHVYQSHTTGAVGDPRWLRMPYPGYWHYNFFQGLTVLLRAGALPDHRANEAISLLTERRQADGLWHAEGSQYWRRSPGTYHDPVPWERAGPSPMLTLNALRVLRIAGG